MRKRIKGSIKKKAIIDCLTFYSGITAEQIQAYTCLSQRCIQYHLRELIETGFVKKDKKPGVNPFTIKARYTLSKKDLTV